MMKLTEELKWKSGDKKSFLNKDVKEEENNYEFYESETSIVWNKLKTNHINS